MRTWLHDSSHAYPEREIPVLAVATIIVTSEAEGHPITCVFDEERGPGASQWIAAEPGDQKLVIAFHQPQTIRQITMEIEEREVMRTQEVQLAVSHDGGKTYRGSCDRSLILAPREPRGNVRIGLSRNRMSPT